MSARVVHHRAMPVKTGALFLLFVLGVYAAQPAPHAESDSLRVGFDAEKGSLVELTAKAVGHDYIDETHPFDLWRAVFMDAREIGPTQARRFTWEASDSDPASVRLVWDDFGFPELPGLRVSAEVALEPTKADARWRIHVEGLAHSPLRSLGFPRVGGLTPLEGETAAVPIWMGAKTSRARALLNAAPEGGRWAWEYPGILSMQWLTVYGEHSPGLRVSTNDLAALRKQFILCGESWLPYLDVMLSLQVSMERYAAPNEWDPLPLFQAVYHDCSTLYGNYSSLTRPPYDELWPAEFAPPKPLELLERKFATQFRLELARAFVWGQQPTLANFRPNHLVERKEEMEFVISLVKLRERAMKYLRDGVFLRPPAIQAPALEIPVSRLSIYAGQQDSVKEYRKTAPMALASAWQAPEGTVGVVVVNIATERVPLLIELDQREYPIHRRGKVALLGESNDAAATQYDEGRIALDFVIEPSEARVYEVTPLVAISAQ